MSDTLPNASTINKIRKLMALADKKSGATEHEALAATAKVQELLQEYGLSMAEIEAGGGSTGDDGKREKTVIKRSSMYRWQRELMETIAEANFCMHHIKEERDEKTGRWTKRHQLIGRSVNVISVQLMYDYLVTTMKKLVKEAGHAPGTHNEQDYHFWLEGCSERLRERIEERARQSKIKSERKAREEEKRRQHPAYAGSGKNALVLSDVYHNEEELNLDLHYGYAPGTTTRARLEREERNRKVNEHFQRLMKDGVDEDEAWLIACGNTPERAKELIANQRKMEAEYEARPQRKSRASTSSRGPSWTKADQRDFDRRHSSSYRAGQQSGEDIGLDKQVTEEEKQRRLGR